MTADSDTWASNSAWVFPFCLRIALRSLWMEDAVLARASSLESAKVSWVTMVIALRLVRNSLARTCRFPSTTSALLLKPVVIFSSSSLFPLLWVTRMTVTSIMSPIIRVVATGAMSCRRRLLRRNEGVMVDLQKRHIENILLYRCS